MKNLSEWFSNFVSNAAVVKRFGKVVMCENAMKPFSAAS